MFASRFLSRALPVLAAAAAFGTPAFASDTTLYSQPYLETADGGYFASSLGGVSQYDSFSLTSTGTIASVAWSGFDLNELIPGTVINPTSFIVNIYSNTVTGKPGQLLSSSTIDNSANAVNTGVMFMDTVTLYDFSGNLATPFQAQAGKTYWIEINDATTNDDWFWATGAGPDGSHIGKLPGQAEATYSDDLAFTLSSVAAVPEPASAAMLGMGLAAVAGIARRRARPAA